MIHSAWLIFLGALGGAAATLKLCRFERRVTIDIVRKSCEDLGGRGNCPDCDYCALPDTLMKVAEYYKETGR